MNTTTETEIITRNEAMLKQIVSRFMGQGNASMHSGMIDRNDMMQEVTLSFLQEVRRYGEAEAVKHQRTLYHSLYMAVIAALPVKTPYYAYSREKRQNVITVDIDEEYSIADLESDTYGEIAVMDMIGGLAEQEQEIVRLRMEGFTQKEIGRRIGLSGVQICRAMKRIRRQLEQA